jgi:uncharacterized protein (TIGR00297 family)
MRDDSDARLDYLAWRQAVQASRDRKQSRWLVRIVGTLLIVQLIATLQLGLEFVPLAQLGVIVAISLVFALAAWGLKAATSAAALFGGLVCLLITLDTSRSGENVLRSGLTPLLLLFVLTFAAGRLGRRRKPVVEADEAEARHGRSASQVIVNLGMAALSAGVSAEWAASASPSSASLPPLLMLAVLAEATADTVSSEIGQAFGGTPFLLPTLERAAPGSDGAISPAGTLAGLAGAAIVAASGAWAVSLPGKEAAEAFAAGIAGLFFDSLLGATVERCGWLGNDLVNFTSTLFAVLLAFALSRTL